MARDYRPGGNFRPGMRRQDGNSFSGSSSTFTRERPLPGWEKSIPRGGPVGVIDPITRLSPAEAREWRKNSIEGMYKNMTPTERRRLRKVAKKLFLRVGAAGMRELLRNSSLPGKLLSVLLDAYDLLADRFPWKAQDAVNPLNAPEFWRYGDQLQGIGMGLLDSDAIPPGGVSNAFPPEPWPFNKWAYVIGAANFVHQYNNPSMFGSLKRYGYTRTLPLAGAGALAVTDALPYPRVWPQYNRGYRRPVNEPLPSPMPAGPFSFYIKGPRVAYRPPFQGPPPGGREGKLSPSVSRLVWYVKFTLGAGTEAMDFLDVMYAASGGYMGAHGLAGNPYFGFQERMEWLFFGGGIANFDWRLFVTLMAVEQLSDAAIAAGNKKAIDNFVGAGWTSVVGPTVGPAL